MDRNAIDKLLEEKKLAETLMKDENFKKEAKKILKEENSSITDEDIKNILSATEKVLSGDVKIKSEEDLDEVVGGIKGLAKGIARKTIKAVCAAGGGIIGNTVGELGGRLAGYAITGEPEYFLGPIYLAQDHPKAALGMGATTVAAMGAGGFGGYKFGNFICDKLGLND